MRIFVDCETDGFSAYRNNMITIAMIVADDNLNKVAEYYDEIQPDGFYWWTDKAEEIHGITKERAKSFRSIEKAVDGLRAFFCEYTSAENRFVCHAQPTSKKMFDYAFIDHFFRRAPADHQENYLYDFYKCVSPYDCRSTVIPKRLSSPISEQNLKAWCKYIGIKLDHHEARSDTNACFEIYKWQQENLPNLEEIEDWYSARRHNSFTTSDECDIAITPIVLPRSNNNINNDNIFKLTS